MPRTTTIPANQSRSDGTVTFAMLSGDDGRIVSVERGVVP
jgi:hypothetical protein